MLLLQCIDSALVIDIIVSRGDLMSKTTISVRIDNDVKENSEKLFNELGLNLSSAINIFLRQSIREKAIPFNVSLKEEEKLDENRMFEDAEKFVDEHIEAFKELAK